MSRVKLVYPKIPDSKNCPPKRCIAKVVDFQNYFRLIPKLRDVLLEEFDHQCAYCDSTLQASMGHVDNFYPKSLFPEKAFQWINLILACQVCSIAKGTKFPVSEDGTPLLLYPGFDNPTDHIKELDDGQLVGLTNKGNTTKVLNWDFKRVIMAHGSIVEIDAKRRFKEGYEWFLGKSL
jgi:hypothetical protein